MRELKGKNTFTLSDIKKLEELIRLRNNTPASGQKSIRQKMRNIGFYGQDAWGITNLQRLSMPSQSPNLLPLLPHPPCKKSL